MTLGAQRLAGSLPATVYGPKQKAISISLERKAFEKVFRAAGESSVISLEGVTEAPLQVLVHEVDFEPITSIVRHADFYAIAKGAKLEIAVPVVFVGEAPAAKAGSNIVKVMHEVEIKADAAHLPHDIEVDISVLEKVGDQVHARDIKLPEGVTLMTHEDEVVALVQEVQEEKEEEVPVAVDMAAIEVEKKGKEEGAEGAEVAKE